VKAAWLPAVAAGALLLGACTERPITGTDPSSAPGQGATTVEVTLPAGSITGWRDTTFTGFARPDDAIFDLVAHQDSFRSRPLGRVGDIGDSLDLNGERWAVDSFNSARLEIVPDTLDLSIPSGGATLQVRALQRSFDASTATWQEASAGQPWDSAGGDLGPVLASASVHWPPQDSTASDTLTVPFAAATVDSVFKAWRTSGGEPGIALVLSDGPARIRIDALFVTANAHIVRPDTAMDLDLAYPVQGRTFIYDPPLPDPGTHLRVGGVPASRAYMEFTPPDSADGHRLRGAQISRAELVFLPLPAPSQGHRLDRAANGELTGLGADFFDLGAKTPVSDIPGTSGNPGFALFPDSLAAGRPLVLDVSGAIRKWAATPPDSSVSPIRVGLRLNPDGQAVGYWEFGSSESAVDLQPVLRLLITPKVGFEIP